MVDARPPSLTSDSRFNILVGGARTGKMRFQWEIFERGKFEAVQASMGRYATMEKAFEAAQPALLEWRRGEIL